MKTLSITLVFLLGISHCEQENMELTYLAQSRGFFLEIQLQSNMLKITDQRGGETKVRELSGLEQKELNSILQSTDFDKVKTSDSTKSHYDAAALAELSLSFNGNDHKFEFDHGYLPKELEILVNKIITLSEIVE